MSFKPSLMLMTSVPHDGGCCLIATLTKTTFLPESSNQNKNYLLILKLALCFYMLHIIRTTILSKKDKWDMLSLRRVGWVVQKQSWVKKSWTNISIPSFMFLNLALKRNHFKKPIFNSSFCSRFQARFSSRSRTNSNVHREWHLALCIVEED